MNEKRPGIIPMGQEYLNRFRPSYGGMECREIARIDYNEKKNVKKYALGASRRCFKAICGSPALLMDIMDEEPKDTPSAVDSEQVRAYGKRGIIHWFKVR
ncbi:MAG: hypothetical protein JRI74_03815 [Deltaproteobacteria bacterium]|nr:hypothetical protein [Deltaproteobacteria bacterium]